MQTGSEGRFQEANGTEHTALTDVVESDTPLSDEFFVYKDATSAEAWVRDGWTPDHANDLLHVLRTVSADEQILLTVVIDSWDGVYGLISDIERGLQSRTSRRVNWEAELQAVGYTHGRNQFSDRVEELRRTLHPDWSADELVCHPHDAAQFCEVARKQIALVPDHLVLKALLNHRRMHRRT